MDLNEFVEKFGTLCIPYKSSLDDFFGEMKLFKRQNEYKITGGPEGYLTFSESQPAFDYFESFFTNIGVLQCQVITENPALADEEDLEKIQEAINKKVERTQTLACSGDPAVSVGRGWVSTDNN
ncbi:MAG: hypothetical protein PHF86_12615 [Candidatus Nanoarchaeia archaeon]|jgi:hypothetical protein|nr:hypothetical protein [Candidatus Nanoarchaeia archaeon]